MLPQKVQERVDLCLHHYSTADTFLVSFTPNTYEHYLTELGSREAFVTNEIAPTLTIAKYAFGTAKINQLIAVHLQQLAVAFGVKTDPVQIDAIADDITSGYGHLKVTEIILFFKMLREGKFRSGENDRGKMFGTLSSEIICDCLYQYKKSYRDYVLQKHEEELKKQEREQDEMRAATYDERKNIFFGKCLQDASFLVLIKNNQWLMDKDIQTIENAVNEFKHLRLLRTRVEEYLKSINKGCDPKTNAAKLEKAIEYLNANYPKQ